MPEGVDDILQQLARLDEGQIHIIRQLADAVRRDGELERLVYGSGMEQGLLTRITILEQQLKDYATRIAPWRLLAFTVAASVISALATYFAVHHLP